MEPVSNNNPDTVSHMHRGLFSAHTNRLKRAGVGAKMLAVTDDHQVVPHRIQHQGHTTGNPYIILVGEEYHLVPRALKCILESSDVSSVPFSTEQTNTPITNCIDDLSRFVGGTVVNDDELISRFKFTKN